MSQFKNKLQRFMMGRYGIDSLYRFLIFLSLILLVINIFVPQIALWIAAMVVLLLSIMRTFSKNIIARRKENALYLKITKKLFGFIPRSIRRFKDRKTHVYKHCPNCKATLRLKKIKGPHTVDCPNCFNEFSVRIK